ncbi:hypothetical protein JTE90_018043 [Oedothorax gibbosus]|uniref:Integrase catalytic domain-containing protein n=1 Tax=Oedothorax gibbosus TaxID=931172 RepID=A0AAV6TUP5_9ARAC|nr:hypothetical protein JTE90_018043 [Oedothorax gibbosus]
MIDRFTRWPEAVAIPDIRAETVAKQFYATWISRFGCPERLTTDQGRQFESALFRALSQLLGIKKLRTSPYHPQSNGLIEEFHRPMKATLKAYDTSEWAAALPTLLLGFRTAFKEDLRATSSELVYGQTIRLPGVFFDPTPTEATPQQLVEELRAHFGSIRPVPTSSHGRRATFVHPQMRTCTHAFVRHDAVRKPLQAPYDGPYPVLEKKEKTFDLEIKGERRTISIDRLKPAFVVADSPPINPSTAVDLDQGIQPSAKKNDKTKIDWSDNAEADFQKCKELIANAVLLAHPKPDANLSLQVDASDFSIGGALMQVVEDELQPLSFFSRKLSPAEKNYSAYDREFVSCLRLNQAFQAHARSSAIHPSHRNHKPLTYAFRQRSDKCSPRQARQLDFFLNLRLIFRYIKGSENIVADALSRISSISMPSPIDYEQIAQAQQNDPELQAYSTGSRGAGGSSDTRHSGRDSGEAVLRHWISRFGCPERLTTDQGRQFESALFRALSQLLGIRS